jgi:hypothetical protein
MMMQRSSSAIADTMTMMAGQRALGVDRLALREELDAEPRKRPRKLECGEEKREHEGCA